MHGWKRYIFAFFITLAIFTTALFASNYLNDRRLAEIRALQEGIATDILSLETQFDLFERHLSCENLTAHTVLSENLSQLANRLSYAESTFGSDDAEVLRIKRSYTLLQIKDLVLMTRISDRCGEGPTIVLYFYSNIPGECDDCRRQGLVLSAITEEFPSDVRVYAFDYHLALGVLDTLVSLNNVNPEFPALIIDNTKVYGYQNIAAIESRIPRLTEIRSDREEMAALEAATSADAITE